MIACPAFPVPFSPLECSATACPRAVELGASAPIVHVAQWSAAIGASAAPEVRTARRPMDEPIEPGVEMARRLGLTEGDLARLLGSLRALWRDLVERKGERARVVRYDGVQLELCVPGLALSATEGMDLLLDRVERTVGAACVERLLAEPLVLHGLARASGLERIAATVRLHFELSAAEFGGGRWAGRGALSVRAEVSFPDAECALAPQVVEHFSWRDVEVIDLGWNAARLIPVGFLETKALERAG